MSTLIQVRSDDPRLRAFRLAGTSSGRPATIHDIVRRQMSELERVAGRNRRVHVTIPWMATR